MSVTTITVIIFAIICVSVAAIYMGQARERSRVERIRKINMYSDRYRRMQQLLHELPPQYLNNELRILISERAVEAIGELLSLKPDARHQEALAQDQAYLKQLRETNPQFKPVPVRDEVAAKNVRQLLEILFRFIEGMGKRKSLGQAAVNKYLDFIRFSACQSRADMFITRAEAAKKIGKYRVAIHNFHNAISAYKEAANHPQAANAIKTFRAEIKALETEANQNKQKVEQQSQEQLDSSTEWDSFLKDDNDWKKKNSYDD